MRTQDRSQLALFATELDFPLDDFQVEACRALEDDRDVLVCAPTGAGKTVVGEFAARLALAAGGRCFYTTPIKALSNQKYLDLSRRFGDDRVGLLTGDISLDPHAPVVVMTTEVLRSMLHGGSPLLHGLTHVVMDEVHYLADRERGAVWEEAILSLPDDVRLTSLSATVSNAEEFGGWLRGVRGDLAVVVEETRPVPLTQHMLAGGRLFDLLSPSGTVDETLERYIAHRQLVEAAPGPATGRGRRRRRARGAPGPAGADLPEVVARLEAEQLLPAIWFRFSRNGCDGAVAECLESSVRLTEAADVAEIRAVADRHTAALPPADLDAVGHAEWLEGLERGFAAHHAGLIPAFRHTVEELFARGLVRVVFATETLAVGVNMPARTVVLGTPRQTTADGPVRLSPGEYTSSPVAPVGAASMSKATPSCCGVPRPPPRPSPASPAHARTRSTVRCASATTPRSTWSPVAASPAPASSCDARSPSSRPNDPSRRSPTPSARTRRRCVISTPNSGTPRASPSTGTCATGSPRHDAPVRPSW
nr:DEAD/DEAH box helicase [Rhodococcus pyridinivorans]